MKIKYFLLTSIILGLLAAQCLPLHTHLFDHDHVSETSNDTHMMHMHLVFDDHGAESHADENRAYKFEQVLAIRDNSVKILPFLLLIFLLVVTAYYLILQKPRHFPKRPITFYIPWRILDLPVLRAPPA